MVTMPSDLRQSLQAHGQQHLLDGWERLSHAEQQELLGQLQRLDLDLLRRLHAGRDQVFMLPSRDRIAPVPVTRLGADKRQARALGEASLRRGEVAALVVAGGQGSRLGFDHPKGMYPIGPVSHKTLFQVHAEKVLALSRRYGQAIPFLVMTSDATHAETEQFFRQQRYFGLPASEVFFFQQGTMPALDLATGKLLLEAPGRLFTSPNGHGGTLTALADSGLLDQLRRRGIRHVFYFQVDNPLVQVADPAFLGHHLEVGSEASSRVVAKDGPKDKLGNMVLIDGRCSIIEYSDLPDDLAHEKDEQGKLRIWAGSPAIHLFTVDFLVRMTADHSRMPFHLARKKVACLDETGTLREPTTENALKFEKFIFDVLPQAERWAVVETSRAEEFAPLKNATGADSPEAVRLALSHLAADWIEAAGGQVPRNARGAPAVPLEISPLFALDRDEFIAKAGKPVRIDGPKYFG
jgi:UDP-N-acetylglucosamine/UDP-N-acetylgalactosamine diphosphorylase